MISCCDCLSCFRDFTVLAICLAGCHSAVRMALRMWESVLIVFDMISPVGLKPGFMEDFPGLTMMKIMRVAAFDSCWSHRPAFDWVVVAGYFVLC